MIDTETKIEIKTPYTMSTLTRFLSSRTEPEWMMQHRQDAVQRYNTLPWPTTKDEEWRRTNISHIDFQDYALLDSYNGQKRTEEVESLTDVSGRIHFKGYYPIEQQVKKSLAKKGIIFTTLTDAAHQHQELLANFLQNANPPFANEKFVTLNAGFCTHGIFMYVPPFVEIAEPFQVLFEEAGHKNASFPHIIVLLDEGARATLIQEIRSKSEGEIFRNALINMQVSDSAAMRYIEIQKLNQKSLSFSNGWTSLGRDAEFYSLVATFGSAVTKTKIGCGLHGSGAHAQLNGIYFADHNQHFDQRTIQYHEAANTSSKAFYKGAVKDNAQTINQGLIKVFKDAQKTDAYQSNKNLILNEKARADSIPSLEIEADDVKCSHGATAGKVNEDEIFYLMTRGLARQEARRMIIAGFFAQVLKDAPEDVQESLRETVENKLQSIQGEN